MRNYGYNAELCAKVGVSSLKSWSWSRKCYFRCIILQNLLKQLLSCHSSILRWIGPKSKLFSKISISLSVNTPWLKLETIFEQKYSHNLFSTDGNADVESFIAFEFFQNPEKHFQILLNTQAFPPVYSRSPSGFSGTFKYQDEFWEVELLVQSLGRKNNVSELNNSSSVSLAYILFKIYTYSSVEIMVSYFQNQWYCQLFKEFSIKVWCLNTYHWFCIDLVFFLSKFSIIRNIFVGSDLKENWSIIISSAPKCTIFLNLCAYCLTWFPLIQNGLHPSCSSVTCICMWLPHTSLF